MVTLPNFPFIFIMGGGGAFLSASFAVLLLLTPWRKIRSRKIKLISSIAVGVLAVVGRAAAAHAIIMAEKGYGIEIETGWPETRLRNDYWPAAQRDKESTFLISYQQDGETFEGKTVVDRDLNVTSSQKGLLTHGSTPRLLTINHLASYRYYSVCNNTSFCLVISTQG